MDLLVVLVIVEPLLELFFLVLVFLPPFPSFYMQVLFCDTSIAALVTTCDHEHSVAMLIPPFLFFFVCVFFIHFCLFSLI